MGDSRKYPYHNTAVFLEFQGQRVGRGGGGSLNWKSKGMKEYLLYDWNSKGMGGGGGVYIWNLHKEQTRGYTMKTLILWILKSVRK